MNAVILVIAAAGFLAIIALALRRLNASIERSAREVADILKQFAAGEPTGYLADDFIHVPISNPVLDQVRERFEALADRHPGWEPQDPFPEVGVQELKRLIAEVEALDV
jgi:hypothetical protein